MSGAGIRTLLVATATLTAIVAAAFALQAVALGRPGPAPLILARTVGKLDAFDEAQTTMTIAGDPRVATCDQHWNEHLRVAVVRVGHGPAIREVADDPIDAHDKRELDEFVLAGCPRPLSDWIGTQLGRGEPIIFRHARLDGVPVYEIRFRRAPYDLQIDVSRAESLPVRLTLRGGGIIGTSTPTYIRPVPPVWWSQ